RTRHHRRVRRSPAVTTIQQYPDWLGSRARVHAPLVTAADEVEDLFADLVDPLSAHVRFVIVAVVELARAAERPWIFGEAFRKLALQDRELVGAGLAEVRHDLKKDLAPVLDLVAL